MRPLGAKGCLNPLRKNGARRNRRKDDGPAPPQRPWAKKHVPQPVSAEYQRDLEERFGQRRLPVLGLE
jgi:hypothetical protein